MKCQDSLGMIAYGGLSLCSGHFGGDRPSPLIRDTTVFAPSLVLPAGCFSVQGMGVNLQSELEVRSYSAKLDDVAERNICARSVIHRMNKGGVVDLQPGKCASV